MGILSIPLCCCPLIGGVLGILAIVKANNVAKMVAQTGMGQEFLSKANTGKLCGIIGIAVAVLNMIVGVILNLTGALANMQAQ